MTEQPVSPSQFVEQLSGALFDLDQFPWKGIEVDQTTWDSDSDSVVIGLTNGQLFRVRAEEIKSTPDPEDYFLIADVEDFLR